MRQRLTWLSTAPLMVGGLLAGHLLGYRLAFSDPHARADALSASGHSYFRFVPLAVGVSLGILFIGLALQALAGFRGHPRRAVASPLIVLLPPLAFVTQETAERIAHTGAVPWTLPLQPAFLFGLALQLPFALAALLLAWVLETAARAIGRALSGLPAPVFPAFVAQPVRVVAASRPTGLARGYGQRAPPLR
jgi:hypothetical protein